MTTPAIEEYNALSVRAKLTYDPSGRPGATLIREDQERIRNRMEDLKRRSGLFGAKSKYLAQQEVKQRAHEVRRRAYMARCHGEALAEEDRRNGSPVALLGTALAARAWKIGPWFVAHDRTEERSYSRYSKSWHRSYGPAVTVSNAAVVARMLRGKHVVKRVELESINGDWQYRALSDLGLIKPVKSKYSLKIRFKSGYDAKLKATKRGYKIYSRTLLGTHIDWVIESPLGMTYHDEDRNNLVRGLHKKIRAAAGTLKLPGSARIDWALCRKLGFCDAGLHDFCERFGLDTKGRYRPEEIEVAVRTRPDAAAPYWAELRTVAKAVGWSRLAEIPA